MCSACTCLGFSLIDGVCLVKVKMDILNPADPPTDSISNADGSCRKPRAKQALSNFLNKFYARKTRLLSGY
eukprot:499264-Pelagomonas_calceolata.AAC.3